MNFLNFIFRDPVLEPQKAPGMTKNVSRNFKSFVKLKNVFSIFSFRRGHRDSQTIGQSFLRKSRRAKEAKNLQYGNKVHHFNLII